MSLAAHVSRTKAGRLVTGGRLVACLAALTTGAVARVLGHETLQPLAILGAWVALAAFLFWSARRSPRPITSPWILVFDLCMVALLLTTTGGVASRYFALILLPPLAAQLLYGRRAMYLTIAGDLVILALAALNTHHGTLDPSLIVLRLSVMVLFSLAVIRRAEFEDRIKEDLEHLATWTHTLVAGREAGVRELLDRAALTLRAPRAAMLWQEAGGASFIARFDRASGAFDFDEDALPDVDAHGETVFFTETGPLTSLLRARSLLGATFEAQTAKGWLFVLDRDRPDGDDLRLAEVVARLASAGLDQINLAEVMRDGAAASERIRLSRDLHDGLLQSLSGLALHAQVARRAVTSDPRVAEERLQTVVEQLAEGQRALRDFVEELRPELTLRRESLRARLGGVAQSVERQWSVPVELQNHVDDLEPRLAGEIVSLVTEGLTNAAKHAQATRLRATLARDDGHVRVGIEDDGTGFPFHGRFDLAQLTAERRGPWSLKERVSALGGELVIDSSPRGSRVEMRIPL